MTRKSPIHDQDLIRLTKEKKSDQEIADYFGVKISSVRERKRKLGIGKTRTAKQIRRHVQQSIFKRADELIVNTNLILNELQRSIATVVAIREHIEQKLSKKKTVTNDEVQELYRNQNQLNDLSDRYTAYIERHLSHQQIQMFMNTLEGVIATLPDEARAQFYENLKTAGFHSIGRDGMATSSDRESGRARIQENAVIVSEQTGSTAKG